MCWVRHPRPLDQPCSCAPTSSIFCASHGPSWGLDGPPCVCTCATCTYLYVSQHAAPQHAKSQHAAMLVLCLAAWQAVFTRRTADRSCVQPNSLLDSLWLSVCVFDLVACLTQQQSACSISHAPQQPSRGHRSSRAAGGMQCRPLLPLETSCNATGGHNPTHSCPTQVYVRAQAALQPPALQSRPQMTPAEFQASWGGLQPACRLQHQLSSAAFAAATASNLQVCGRACLCRASWRSCIACGWGEA